MRILSVDDSEVKQEALKGVCSECRRDCSFVPVGSILEARRALSKEQFDVMLLDVVIPNIDGLQVNEFGGIELLKELHQNRTVIMPKYIIIITEYSDILDRIATFTDKSYVNAIKYDSSNIEWQERLTSFLSQIDRALSEPQINDYFMAVICALRDPELEEVKKWPIKWVGYNEPGDRTNYYVGEYKGEKIICAASHEMGMPAASVLATKMIHKFKPRYLAMSGIAAAVSREELSYGDVMIADPCFDYGSGKRVFEDGKSIFKPDYRQIRLDRAVAQMIEKIQNNRDLLDGIQRKFEYIKPKVPLTIHIGHFGSGSSVLADPSKIKEVKEHERKFMGFDMEAYGVMLAGELTGEPATVPIVLKSVSDFGDDNKNDEYQRYASYTSAQVLFHLLDMMISDIEE